MPTSSDTDGKQIDDDNEESLPKRPRIAQPQVVEPLGNISDAVRNLFGDDMARGPGPGTAIVSVDKLQAIAEKVSVAKSRRIRRPFY